MFMPGVFLRFYALSHLNLQRLYRRILTIGILFICMMLTKMINNVKNFLAKGVGGSDKHFRPPLPPSYCLPLIFATTGLVWFFTHITILIEVSTLLLCNFEWTVTSRLWVSLLALDSKLRSTACYSLEIKSKALPLLFL